MKFLSKFLLIGFVIAGCTSFHQSTKLQIPEDTQAVKIVEKSKYHTKTDPVFIKHVEQNGDYIIFSISYSGGCEDHDFELVSTGHFTPTYPPEVEIFLKHDNKGDGCRAVIDTKLFYDLRPLKNDATTQVLLVIKNTNKTLEYNY